jgi:glycosyltransferase involved in cell wall biosynthesis
MVRIVLVGTDMAPVHHEVGALERLLAGWAAGLSVDDEVFVLSIPARTEGEASAPGTGAAEILRFSQPQDLRRLVDKLAPDAVVINNRPAWQGHVPAPTVHLFHNWPDAWDVPAGASASAMIAGAATAAVSASLAATVAAGLGRPLQEVGIVGAFVDEQLFSVDPHPEPGLVVSPNRLMVKKGIAELVAASAQPQLAGHRIVITDYLSPWIVPTEEHLQLRRLVNASATCALIDPPAGRSAVAALYARADVVVCASTRPEGLGLSAIEAQAVGVPVVSSGLGGLAEATLMPDLIADPHDASALADAIGAAGRVGTAARAGLRDEAKRRFSLPVSLDAIRRAIATARPA